MSRLLITGATGFVGGHLVRRAVASGHEVVAATRGDLTVPGATILPVGGFETAGWDGRLKGIDAVIHLAARVHQMHDTAADPLAAFRAVNRDATMRLATAARDQGVKRFVFLSTVKAAVDLTGAEGVDDGVVPDPHSPYGISKREAEQALLDLDGMPCVILRPPLVYGSGAKGNLVSFYRLARSGLPMPFGRIQNARSLIGVSNLARALVHAVTLEPEGPPVYFVEDTRVSTGELYRAIAASLNRPARIVPVPLRAMKLAARLTDKSDVIDRLTESLAVDGSRFRATGWSPSVPMAQELETIAHTLYR